MMEKIIKYAAPFAFAAALGACSAMPQKYESRAEQENKFYIIKAPNYLMRSALQSRLRTAAGILSGDIKARKTERGYFSEGTFSQASKPEFYEKACEMADINGDMTLTKEEITALMNKLMRENAR